MAHSEARPELGKEIRAHQFFNLGFGTIVGVGWIVFLGNWLEAAGPVGAILAFGLGGIVVILVGFCYAELTSVLPVSGGEVAYAYEIYGTGVSYATGWMLALPYTLVTSFEIISVGWVIGALVPGIQGPVLYEVFDYPVQLGSLILGIVGTLVFTSINYRGIKTATRAQDIFTYGLIALSLVFVVVGIGRGSLANLQPYFGTEGGVFLGVGFLTILFTVPTWLAGFNIIPQLMEEKAPGASLKTVSRIILGSIIAAAAFYSLLILSSSMSLSWTKLLDFELPAAGAFNAAFNSPLLANTVLVAGLCGLLSTWNTAYMAASRVLFALGRAHIIPTAFGTSHPRYRTPAKAILFVCVAGFLAALLGKSMLVPIINALSTSFAFAFFISCYGLIRLRRRQPERQGAYRAPGGVATAGVAAVACLFMLFISIYLPYVDAVEAGRTIPIEWGILLVWIALGFVFWKLGAKHRIRISEPERRRLMLGSAIENQSN